MDTSKEYIEMCQEAKEIQEEWKPEYGDWNGSKGATVLDADYDEVLFTVGPQNKIHKYVWLPRQDQLQEMIDVREYLILVYSKDPKEEFNGYHYNLEYYLGGGKVDHFFGDTAEKVYLQAVMLTKYKKQWDGNKWHVLGSPDADTVRL